MFSYFFFFLCGVAWGSDELRIHNASELIKLSDNVNSGTSYSGTTIFLDSDIDFSGELSQQFNPIGKDDSNCFRGTFDGQGHVISNLIMNSSLQYVGLFGYSDGSTIKNVVLDESCSITSTRNTGQSSVGGLIGYCSGPCNIRNNVNLATITYNGNTKSYALYIGGIIGHIYFSAYEIIVRNCANYGPVVHSGSIGSSNIGGVASYFQGNNNNKGFIQNCMNYGSIIHNGTTSNILSIGGISSGGSGNILENCLSVGPIITAKTANKNYIGSIIGQVSDSVNITHSFWTSNVGYNNVSGSGTPTTDADTSEIELNSDNVAKMNAYAEGNGWSKWVLNSNNVSVSFRVNNGKSFTLNSQVILLPDLLGSGESSKFSGWYDDSYCTQKFNQTYISEGMSLYGLYGLLVIVTFNANEGGVSPSSKLVAFNTPYGDLPTPTRDGYSFLGWFVNENENITSETIVSNSANHALCAHWNENLVTTPSSSSSSSSTQIPSSSSSSSSSSISSKIESSSSSSQSEASSDKVEIVFGRKDLTREEVEDIIREYTSETFTIIKFDDEDGELKVIVKFTDTEKASEFVRKIETTVRSSKSLIKDVNFVYREYLISFAFRTRAFSYLHFISIFLHFILFQ